MTDVGGSDERGLPSPALPRWLPVATFSICLLLVAVSAYLTWEHFHDPTGDSIVCPANETFDCTKVTTSEQSRFLGVPVAVLGLLYAIVMTGLTWPAAWRSHSALLRWLRLVGAAGGLVFVVWLVYAELVLIHAICMWCTVVHVLTLVLFVLVIYGTFGVVDADAIDAGGSDAVA